MMLWLQFFAAILALVVIVFLPGRLLLSAAPMRPAFRWSLAPVVTVPLYSLTVLAYRAVGLACSWALLFVPWLVLGFVVFIVDRAARKRRGLAAIVDDSADKDADEDAPARGRHVKAVEIERKAPAFSRDYLVLGTFVLVAVVVTGLVFVKNLDGPLSFEQDFDNYSHLARIRSFIDSGVWSLGGIAKYPTAFHMLGAAVVSLTGCSVTMASNVTVATMLAFIWPASVFSFIGQAFRGKRRVWVWGALAACAIPACPWRILIGVLYPNILGAVLAPGAMALFMKLVDELPKHVVWNLVLFVLGALGLAFAHPNSIFMCVVVLVPFCVSRILRAPLPERLSGSRGLSRTAHWVLAILFVAVVCWIWLFLNASPMFADVVEFPRPTSMALRESVARVLTASFVWSEGLQYLTGGLVALGAVFCLVRRRNLWLVATYALAAVPYLCAASIDEEWRTVFSGFWYNDLSRVALVAGFAAILLMTVGFYAAWSLVKRAATAVGVDRAGRAVLCCCCVAVFMVVTYYPSFEIIGSGQQYTAFGDIYATLADHNSLEDGRRNLSTEEMEFIKSATKDLPDDAVIINLPFDGSVYSYGTTGKKLAYQRIFYPPEQLTSIQSNLKDIATDPEVQKDVKEMGAEYVILLDSGGINERGQFLSEMNRTWWDGTKYDWSGIYDIKDGTPGFKLLKSEGDMRLYEIENPAA